MDSVDFLDFDVETETVKQIALQNGMFMVYFNNLAVLFDAKTEDVTQIFQFTGDDVKQVENNPEEAETDEDHILLMAQSSFDPLIFVAL